MGRLYPHTNLYGMDTTGTPPQLEQCNLRPHQRVGCQYQGNVQQTPRQLSRMVARRGKTQIQTFRAYGQHIGNCRSRLPGNHRVGRKSGGGTRNRRSDGSPLGGSLLAQQPHEIARTISALGMRFHHAATLHDGRYGKYGQRYRLLFPPRMPTGQKRRKRQAVCLCPVVRDRDVRRPGRRLRFAHRHAHRLRTYVMAPGSHPRSDCMVPPQTKRICPAHRHDGRISQ